MESLPFGSAPSLPRQTEAMPSLLRPWSVDPSYLHSCTRLPHTWTLQLEAETPGKSLWPFFLQLRTTTSEADSKTRYTASHSAMNQPGAWWESWPENANRPALRKSFLDVYLQLINFLVTPIQDGQSCLTLFSRFDQNSYNFVNAQNKMFLI